MGYKERRGYVENSERALFRAHPADIADYERVRRDSEACAGVCRCSEVRREQVFEVHAIRNNNDRLRIGAAAFERPADALAHDDMGVDVSRVCDSGRQMALVKI